MKIDELPESIILKDKILKYLKELDGCSLRQVSRLTGFTVNKIFKV